MKEKMKIAFMKTAFIFAELSTAKRNKVGAIVVKNKRILSIGYNGTPSGWNNECETDSNNTKPEVIHAEANCLGKLALAHESSKNAVMFITLSPCIECAKLIHITGIKKVYYAEEYRDSGGINFLKKCKIKTEKITI